MAVLVSRTPLRVSFAGGGTDLPPFYRVETGGVTGMAVDRYVYIGVNRRTDDRVRFSYSRTENVDSAEELEHPIAREALRLLGVTHGVEIVSVADVPAGTGLGSSGSFTVGLLAALHALAGRAVPPAELAAQACHVELDLVGEPVGKQDQYLAAFGGLRHVRFHPDERVTVESVSCPPALVRRLQAGLLLFDTGVARRAGSVLAGVAAAAGGGREHQTLCRMRDIATAMRELLSTGGDMAAFGRLLHEGWECKRRLGGFVSVPDVDRRYARALAAGALGGKLLGAGGGGFLLVLAPPGRHAAVRDAVGLPHLQVRLDTKGTCLYRLR